MPAIEMAFRSDLYLNGDIYNMLQSVRSWNVNYSQALELD